jgi:two-component system, sensor histidine kinase and response regulator
MKGDRERCLAAGMDNYIAKPIRAEHLFDTIASVLGDSGSSCGAGGPLARGATETAAKQVDGVVDWNDALAAVDGDRALLGAVARAFLQESPGLMEGIRRAVAAGNAPALRIAAHTLKGSMRCFAAPRAAATVFELEKMGQENRLQNAGDSLAALETEFAQVATALRNQFPEISHHDDHPCG